MPAQHCVPAAPPSKTTHQPPTAVLQLAGPSISRALPTRINAATFSTAAITSRSSNALTAVKLLVIMWLFTLLALSLTYKPVRLVARRSLTNLCRQVRQVTTWIVLSAKSAITTSSSAVYADILVEKIVFPYADILFKTIQSAAAWDVADIVVPYADIVLVIAASPAVFVAGVLIAVLLGFIKPTSDIPPAFEVGPADFVAGKRTRRKRLPAAIVRKDHSGGALLDIRRLYQYILRTRDQERAARSCAQHLKKLASVSITITLLALSFGILASAPARFYDLAGLTLPSSVELDTPLSRLPPPPRIPLLP
ncbi:hypothetical protein JB92DRAFT_3133071 [Gautieria morchelliformis]|nr:hypothetical protein JB92DRAFT_3133071 [Gautieria morchelliformis]